MNHIWLTNGARDIMRQTLDNVRKFLGPDDYDVDVCFDFYKAAKTGGRERTAHLSRLMDTELQYRHNYIFIFDDTSDGVLHCAYEMLFNDYNSFLNRHIRFPWFLYLMPSSKGIADAKKIVNLITTGEDKDVDVLHLDEQWWLSSFNLSSQLTDILNRGRTLRIERKTYENIKV